MSERCKATALVVDDEPLLRMDLAGLLQAAGYRTREAGCAADAVAILEQHTDFELVFTDIQMPGSMDGLALSRYIRDRLPQTIIVICSGNRTPSVSEMPSGSIFLAKPFETRQLRAVLKNVEVKLSATRNKHEFCL